MASVGAIRDGLKVRLATISGLRAYDTVPGTIVAPAAIVTPGDPLISFDSTMGRGSDDLNFVALVIVQYATERVAQDALDAYLAGSGALSVKSAIEEDGTLGGIVSFSRVATAAGYGDYEFNGIKYLGVEFRIEVTT